MEPRSIAFRPDRWLTDSRVYNLIWMGRWLERADKTARVINTRPLHRGERQPHDGRPAIDKQPHSYPRRIHRQSASHAGDAPRAARGFADLPQPGYGSGNPTQVDSVEQIRALSEAVLTLEDDSALPQTPTDPLLLTSLILYRLRAIYEAIDHNWFHQEALPEEEAYRRLVQQQQ